MSIAKKELQNVGKPLKYFILFTNKHNFFIFNLHSYSIL